MKLGQALFNFLGLGSERQVVHHSGAKAQAADARVLQECSPPLFDAVQDELLELSAPPELRAQVVRLLAAVVVDGHAPRLLRLEFMAGVAGVLLPALACAWAHFKVLGDEFGTALAAEVSEEVKQLMESACGNNDPSPAVHTHQALPSVLAA